MSIVFWGCLVVVCYIYVGYPLLLWVMRYLRERTPVVKRDFFPRVTLIISAYNEAAIIRQKIENSLALHYPAERLEILVVSDASTDATDQIVSAYQDRGVVLFQMPERQGKTMGLNQAVPVAKGEIIIFSDANALYDPEAIRHLVAHFADPTVGYVTGASRYIKKASSFVGWCENLYWNYDLHIKVLESQLGSMVGADGAIYAIRKGLYTPLQPQDINDFVNPLQIIAKGFRGIFEPAAVCHEQTVDLFGEEYRRKVRIIARSVRALFLMRILLNPYRFGWYAVELWSHKLLRWFTPVFLCGMLLSNLWLWADEWIYRWMGLMQMLLYASAGLGYVLSLCQMRLRVFYIPYYFCLMMIASMHGIWKALQGAVPSIWEPEREAQKLHAEHQKRVFVPLLSTLLIIGSAVVLTDLLLTAMFPGDSALFIKKMLFWSLAGLMGYTVIGYPLTLAVWARIARAFRPSIPSWDPLFFPAVTLLIPAFNEERVIAEKIENSLRLNYPRDKLQIVVASDGSTDKTNAIVHSYHSGSVELWPYAPRRGKMAVINRAMEKVSTEIVVLSDANAFYDANALQHLVKHFQDPEVGAVSGKIALCYPFHMLGKPNCFYQRYEDFLKTMETHTGSIIGVDGAMYALRKDLYQPMPDSIILDDLVISMQIARQGKRVIFEAAATGYEYAGTKIAEGFWTTVRIMAGAIQTLKQRVGLPTLQQPAFAFKYLFHKFFRWQIPLLLWAILILNISLMIAQREYLMLLGIQVTCYGLALLGYVTRSPRMVFSVPFYFCMQNIAASVGLWRGILDKQSVLWEKAERFTMRPEKGRALEKRKDQPSL
jgi:cellulose synthase/poly-beta-1,6-N-acetylglucosamine synthase-like glycosyltransferase